jgi:pheromone a factor receptor
MHVNKCGPGIALRWFVHRRVQFRTTLQSSQSGLTVDHYFRLIALSITEMVYMLSMCVFIAYTNLQQYGFRPWVSWDYVHEDWFRIVQYSKVLVPNFFWDYYLPIWYIIPLTSMIFFAFFGFGREANAEYAKWFQWIRTCVFRMKSNAAPVLPIS